VRHTLTVINKTTGAPQNGYTVSLYAYSTGSSGYSGSALYTYTDGQNGTYYADVTTTIKGTVVVVTSGGSTVVPPNKIGIIVQGDNQPTIQPGGTT